MDFERQQEWFDRYDRFWRRRVPRRAAKLASLPLGRRSHTDEAFIFESARMVRTAFAYLYNEGLAGDYVEFGVFKGRTFVEAWHSAEYFGLTETRFVAFDSFAGLPDPGDDSPFFKGQFAAPRQNFERTLKAHSVSPDRTQVVEGFFESTLSKERRALLPSQVAVAWVDCDLYESTVPVLDYLGEVLIDGAVLIFDDWFTHKGRADRGEQKACNEWLAKRSDITLIPYRQHSWGGQAFLVNRGG